MSAVKWAFLARLQDQPRLFEYKINPRVMARFMQKSGRVLYRFLKFLSKPHPEYLQEYISARADVKFIREEFGSGEKLISILARHKLFKNRMPLDYLLGWVPFCGNRFVIRRPVLIPRRDTEDWIYELIQEIKGRGNLRILEVGTGSGCIGISICKACPNVRVTSIDISKTALDLAKQNAKLNLEGSNTFEAMYCNVFDDPAIRSLGEFDLVISNPPYVPRAEWASKVSPSVRRWESNRALIGGSSKLGISFHKRLLDLANGYYHKSDDAKPILAMEFNGSITQLNVIKEHIRPLRHRIILDLSKRPRAIFVY